MYISKNTLKHIRNAFGVEEENKINKNRIILSLPKKLPERQRIDQWLTGVRSRGRI